MECFVSGCEDDARMMPRVKSGPVDEFVRKGVQALPVAQERERAKGLAWANYSQFSCCDGHTAEAAAAVRGGRDDDPCIQIIASRTGRDVMEATIAADRERRRVERDERRSLARA